jgi:alpha-tubulin suppressor-like RCC1 family protein
MFLDRCTQYLAFATIPGALGACGGTALQTPGGAEGSDAGTVDVAVPDIATSDAETDAPAAAPPDSRSTARVPLSTVTAVATGNAFACALVADGSVWCWGDGERGQLGNGTAVDSSTPVPVSGLSGATAIAAGDSFACALLPDGSVQCWGDIAYATEGTGSTSQSLTPVAVPGLRGVTAISAGFDFACALLPDGSVQCWGDVEWDGPASWSSVPVAVSGLSGVTAISAGNPSCALLAGGSVECWGGDLWGQLGDDRNIETSTPVVVSGVSDATAVSSGSPFACVLRSGGTVTCWGDNEYGEVGNGPPTDVDVTFAPVSGLTGVTAISAGYEFACAVVSGGTVECWGFNDCGQLGEGVKMGQTCYGFPCSEVPVVVTGLSGVTAVSAGLESTCALLATGSVECWGYNEYGELGDGTERESSTPVTVGW